MTDSDFSAKLNKLELTIGQLVPMLPEIEAMRLHAISQRQQSEGVAKGIWRRYSNRLENVRKHVAALVR